MWAHRCEVIQLLSEISFSIATLKELMKKKIKNHLCENLID